MAICTSLALHYQQSINLLYCISRRHICTADFGDERALFFDRGEPRLTCTVQSEGLMIQQGLGHGRTSCSASLQRPRPPASWRPSPCPTTPPRCPPSAAAIARTTPSPLPTFRGENQAFCISWGLGIYIYISLCIYCGRVGASNHRRQTV